MVTRVGMIATRCQPEIGGIESHVAEVAGRLVARGYDLEILTTDRSGDLPRARADRRATTVRRFRAFPAGRDWYFSPGLFWAALRARYDLVHVQGVHTLVPPLAMLAALLRRTPFLLTFHTGGNCSAFREKARRHPVAHAAPLLRRAHTARSASRSSRPPVRGDDAAGPEGAITVIRNGGSLPAGCEAGDARGPAWWSASAGSSATRATTRRSRRCPHLLETHPEARVEILGAGPYEAELLALAERLGVGDRVSIRFIPPVDRALMGERIASRRRDDAAQRLRGAPGGRHGGAHGRARRPWSAGPRASPSSPTSAGPSAWTSTRPPEETARGDRAPARRPRAARTRPTLPTWETCVAGVADTYDSIMKRRA